MPRTSPGGCSACGRCRNADDGRESHQDERRPCGVRSATLARLAALEDRVRAAVASGQLADPATVDALRGLVVTDRAGDADRAATARRRRWRPVRWARSTDRRSSSWRNASVSTTIDLDLLLIAAAPDLDPRFEQLFGYLHDDVTQRRASIGLALAPDRSRADGCRRPDAGSRRHAPLRRAGLIDIVDAARPYLTRPLRVPDRIVAALLGDGQGPHGRADRRRTHDRARTDDGDDAVGPAARGVDRIRDLVRPRRGSAGADRGRAGRLGDRARHGRQR